MRAHYRYLKYVLIHKWYVLGAGLLIGASPALGRFRRVKWLWRLLIHDWSKFTPAEWTPYVNQFYAPPAVSKDTASQRRAAFDRAWLHHLHHNPHHWQHWILRQDDGKTLILLPPSYVAEEMLADWIGAGSKILAWPSLSECVLATCVWYAKNHAVIQLRSDARLHIENILLTLAKSYGLDPSAIELARAARVSVSIQRA